MDAAVEQDTPASAPHLDGGADIDLQVLELVAEELKQFPGINSVEILPQVRQKTRDTLEVISFLPKRGYVLGLFLGFDTIRHLKI